jgi:hypothetical protein
VPPTCTFSAGRSLEGSMVGALGGRLRLWGEGGGVADGIGKRQQVIGSWLLRSGRHGQAQHFPSAGHRQGIGVLLAEVVAVRLGVGGQRTQDGGGVRVHVRQGGYRRLAAGRPRTLTDSSHDITDYPFATEKPRIGARADAPPGPAGCIA